MARGRVIVLGIVHVWIVAHTVVYVLNQGQLRDGFCSRKLTSRDQFSNDFRMEIATCLYVLLA